MLLTRLIQPIEYFYWVFQPHWVFRLFVYSLKTFHVTSFWWSLLIYFIQEYFSLINILTVDGDTWRIWRADGLRPARPHEVFLRRVSLALTFGTAGSWNLPSSASSTPDGVQSKIKLSVLLRQILKKKKSEFVIEDHFFPLSCKCRWYSNRETWTRCPCLWWPWWGWSTHWSTCFLWYRCCLPLWRQLSRSVRLIHHLF